MPMKSAANMPMKRVTSKRKPTVLAEPPSDTCPLQQRRYLEARMTRIERNVQAAFRLVGLQSPQMESNDDARPSRSWSDVDARMVRDLNVRMARVERHMQTLVDHTDIKHPPTP